MKYFNKKIIVLGNQVAAVQAMIDFDYVLGKESPSILGIVDSNAKNQFYLWGAKPMQIPTCENLEDLLYILKKNNKDLEIWGAVNFTSSRNVFKTTKELIQNEIENIFILAENVPERESRILDNLSENKINIYGPASVGLIFGGQLKISHAGGTIDNVIREKLYTTGNVLIISKSGGMLNELCSIVTRNIGGVYAAVAVGGDRFPTKTIKDVVVDFSKDKNVKLIFILGEVGGRQELELAEYLSLNKISQKVIVHILGESKYTDKPIQFGHAGAMANSDEETTAFKKEALSKAGAVTVDNFGQITEILSENAKKIGIQKLNNSLIPKRDIPKDLKTMFNSGEVRYLPEMITSVNYDFLKEKNKNFGQILFSLWFKLSVDVKTGILFETIIKLLIDHGANVSGAQNTIVSARAGKDLVSSVVSGLLTIGPKFGGAINDSAKFFKMAIDKKKSAKDFVNHMKDNNLYIPGIGHKVKSLSNPDERVIYLEQEFRKIYKKNTYINFAREVEKITTSKKDNLILNIDGMIACIFLEILIKHNYTSDQIDKILESEVLNGIFVFARNAGFIAHFIDQKNLKQDLYRRPQWDIINL